MLLSSRGHAALALLFPRGNCFFLSNPLKIVVVRFVRSPTDTQVPKQMSKETYPKPVHKHTELSTVHGR